MRVGMGGVSMCRTIFPCKNHNSRNLKILYAPLSEDRVPRHALGNGDIRRRWWRAVGQTIVTYHR